VVPLARRSADYEIDTDAGRVDVDAVHRFTRERSLVRNQPMSEKLLLSGSFPNSHLRLRVFFAAGKRGRPALPTSFFISS
jgi:hypothetical protein